MLIGDINAKDSVAYDELAYWLALNQRSNYFSPRVVSQALLESGESLKDLWYANTDILSRSGFSGRAKDEFDKIRSSSSLEESNRIVEDCYRQGINIFRFIDEEYPQQLRETPSSIIPPLILFHKGSLKDFSNCVAIVGTRDSTFRGRSMARKIARALADDGFTIVSGLARGTDVEAHMGALESKKGKTIAVLAWFDPVYPEEHTELVKEIEERGARISENLRKSFGSMTPAKFVERNRITSGISKFIIITETGEDGGTMRQAELAKRENRPIFVMAPKRNERIGQGFQVIMERHNGISFSDVDDLLDKIKANKLEPDKKLSQFSLNEQSKLL